MTQEEQLIEFAWYDYAKKHNILPKNFKLAKKYFTGGFKSAMALVVRMSMEKEQDGLGITDTK